MYLIYALRDHLQSDIAFGPTIWDITSGKTRLDVVGLLRELTEYANTRRVKVI